MAEVRAARRKWLGVLANLVLVAASCVVAIVIAEVAVRVARIGSDQLLRPDPVLGVRFIPSKTGLTQGACYSAEASISADGWRSPVIAAAKPDGVYRILVLGDSFMAGLQVNDDETFSRVLERELAAAHPGQRFEVVNFGVPSWGTDQQYLALREYGLALDPDLVLLAFYAQNDVDENSMALRSATNTYPKPYFEYRDGRLVQLPFRDDTPAPIRWARQAVAPLRIYPLVRDALLTIPAVHRVLYQLGIVGVVPQAQPSAADDPTIWKWPDRWRRQVGVFEREYGREREHAWEITRALLTRLAGEAEGSGARFLVMGVASPIEVMPPALLEGLVGEGGGALDVDKPARLLQELAEREQFALFSLSPGFREAVAGNVETFERYYLSCDGHWTPAGHRLAAEIAARIVAGRLGTDVKTADFTPAVVYR